jgi:hypothetical protein
MCKHEVPDENWCPRCEGIALVDVGAGWPADVEQACRDCGDAGPLVRRRLNREGAPALCGACFAPKQAAA